ncbi:peptidylprolyl isomerase PrsA [Desulfatiferula olefinivorans]
MTKRKTGAFLVGLVLTGFVLGCGMSDSGGSVVARYKGGVLTAEDLAAHREILEKQKQFRDKPEQLTPEFVFDHAVNMEMIIAKGLKENLHLDPRIRAELHRQMSELFLKVMQDRLVEKIDRDSLTDEMVRAHYDEHIEAYTTPETYGIRLIAHDDPAFLADLKAKIEEGDVAFDDAARTHSSDEKTRSRGGDAGTRALSSYRPAWRPVIEALSVDGLSDPFAYEDRYYLIQLTRKTEKQVQSFDEKKEYIRNDLLYARYREAWQTCYDGLRKEFRLMVDDHELGHFTDGKCAADHKEEHHDDPQA